MDSINNNFLLLSKIPQSDNNIHYHRFMVHFRSSSPILPIPRGKPAS